MVNTNSETDAFKKQMYGSMLVGVVAGTLRKQYKITKWTDDYHLYTMFGEPAFLRPNEYKRLRRGVRWILSRAGYDGKTVMPDKVLKGILLNKLKITIRE